jgi:histidine triad (HIT) family protein
MLKAFLIYQYASLRARLHTPMSDCIFCKIVKNEAPATVVYRDEQVTAFRDIHPVAPTHIVIVPNKHIGSVSGLTAGDEALAGRLLTVAGQLASQEGIAQSGYRLITNTGAHGGQTVFHLHVHLIGGQPMRHPMG